MPRNLSPGMIENINSTNSQSVVLALLTLNHPDLPFPIRLVKNNEDIVSNGERYVACYFEEQLYNDSDGQAPSAGISIDNVGGELAKWIDRSNGAKNLRFDFAFIETGDVDNQQSPLFGYLKNISMTRLKVSATISLDDILSKRSVNRVANQKYAIAVY